MNNIKQKHVLDQNLKFKSQWHIFVHNFLVPFVNFVPFAWRRPFLFDTCYQN
jgi:hypothetical protein